MAHPARRPPPNVQFRTALADFKFMGATFEEAWDGAWREVVWPHDTNHRRQWKTALRGFREEWRACYEDMPSTASSNMAVLAAALAAIEKPDAELVGVVAA